MRGRRHQERFISAAGNITSVLSKYCGREGGRKEEREEEAKKG